MEEDWAGTRQGGKQFHSGCVLVRRPDGDREEAMNPGNRSGREIHVWELSLVNNHRV